MMLLKDGEKRGITGSFSLKRLQLPFSWKSVRAAFLKIMEFA